MMKGKDLEDLQTEIEASSAMVLALCDQLDNEVGALSKKKLQDAILGVSRYLGRIADDVYAICKQDCIERKRGGC